MCTAEEVENVKRRAVIYIASINKGGKFYLLRLKRPPFLVRP